jgi:lambda family phage portal protein
MSAQNRLEKVIAAISPAWAFARARNRIAWEATQRIRSRDGEDSRLQRVKRLGMSQDQRNSRTAQKMREEARWLEDTFDIASGALDVLVANIVGQGIQPEPQVKTKDKKLVTGINQDLLSLWDDWIHTPEVTHEYDYYTMQGLVARTWVRDGEMFGQHLIGDIASLDHGTIVPYSLEMLEPDYVPIDLTDDQRNIVQGIELNGWGRPRAYHVYKEHPGGRGKLSAETKRVSADRMMHLKRTKRLESTRGLTDFATVIARAGDIQEIDESERIAARVAAAMAGYIKKGSPDNYNDASGIESSTGEKQALRMMEFVPGMIFDDLQPGEEIGTISNNRPNNALIEFRNSQLKSMASGIGAGASSISKNYSGTYSSQRQELIEQYVLYRRLTGTFIYRFCQPIWDNFVRGALAARLIKVTRDVDIATIYDVTHTPPPMPWIDPLKEAMANDLLEKRKFKSRPRIIRERGENPDQVNLEIQRDAEERKRMGIIQESDNGQPSGQDSPKPAAPGEADPDSDDGEKEDTENRIRQQILSSASLRSWIRKGMEKES